MNLTSCLMKTGLTRHESEFYIALCREGELTGYEAAKVTGIPRANAYQALAALVDKGAAYIIEGDALRYTSVAVEEYCRNTIEHMQEVITQIKLKCPQTRKKSEPYITITGYKHIIDKIRNIIRNTRERVYVSVSAKELPFLKEDLEEAVRRGLKVVAILSGGPGLEGAIVHRINRPSGQIRLIADSSYVLTGNITGSDDDICLYSKNRPLVELIKDSLKNEIRLAEYEEAEENV